MRRSALLFLLLLLSLSSASAAEVAEKFRRDLPVDVTSERLEAEEAAGRVRFIGRVVAVQGDVTIYAREMTLFLQPETRDVERIEAQGEVRIVQGDRVATGEKGAFFRNEGRIVLSGDPKVHQGDDFIAGEEIVVYLEEERSVVRGGEGRVKAIFHPKGSTP